MGDMSVATAPRCPVHGQMQYQPRPAPQPSKFTCAGWDGEGCPHVVIVCDLDWQPVTSIHFDLTVEHHAPRAP